MFTSCTMSKSQDSMLTSFVFPTHSLSQLFAPLSFVLMFSRDEQREQTVQKKKNTKIIRMQINLNRIERCKRYM